MSVPAMSRSTMTFVKIDLLIHFGFTSRQPFCKYLRTRCTTHPPARFFSKTSALVHEFLRTRRSSPPLGVCASTRCYSLGPSDITIEQGIGNARDRVVHNVVERIDGNLLRSPLGDRRRNVEGRQYHLFAAPDYREMRHARGRSGKPRSREESPTASPRDAVTPVNDVIEAHPRGLVLRSDVEHFGGGLRWCCAHATPAQLCFEGTGDRHSRRSGRSGEQAFADCFRDVSKLHISSCPRLS